MKNILLIGAGKIGVMITEFLSSTNDYHVTVADVNEDALNHINTSDKVEVAIVNIEDEQSLLDVMNGKYAVISAAPFHLTIYIAKAAKKAGLHYFDLTEDVACTKKVKELASDAETAFIPQCGLAPGFISIVAYDLAKNFDDLHDLKMRVGALTKFPSNGLKYNLTWSTDGLINEYCHPCTAIIDGSFQEVPALASLEKFSLDGTEYEAFNTSGGLGTLCETLNGRVKNLNYKSVRYPGHCDILKLLLHDLKLKDRPQLLVDLFNDALPFTYQDVVLVFVTATGKKGNTLEQETYAHKIYAKEIRDKKWSAIQITTASGVCAMLDLLSEGKLPAKGFVKQEDADFKDFVANRFGKNYDRRSEER